MAESNSDDRDIDFDQRGDVSALASAVLSVITDKPQTEPKTIRGALVNKLIKATLRRGAFDADKMIDSLRDDRISPEQIMDIYIPSAAKELGVMWLDDRIGFAQVTIATARLQGLLTQLAPPWSSSPLEPGEGVRSLMILPDNDSHTLGPHVATAQMRRIGASVRLLFAPDPKTLLRILDEDRYDLVMFSCSRTESLATVGQMVKRIRTDMDGTPPIALGGLVLDLTDRIKEKTGVDLVSSDIRVALKLCDNKRLKSRSMARR